MNLTQFFNHLRRDPSWADKNCEWLPLESISILDDGGQVRQGGTNNPHIAALKEDILLRGQTTPITVNPDPLPDNTLGADDGNHRLKALRELKDKCPDQGRFDNIWVYKKKFSSEEEKVQYQLEANNHPPAKPSSKEDIAVALHNQLKRKGGGCDGVTWKNFNSCATNTETLIEWMKKRWAVNKRTGRTVVKVCLKDAPGAKLINYSKSEVVKKFSDLNSLGWSGKKPGDKCNSYVVYPVASDDHIFPNITGNSFKKKTNEGRNTKTVVVAWESNTFGKNADKLKAYRKTIVNKINDANNSWLLASGVKLVDEVVFIPQSLKEIKNKLLTSVKDSNGSFTTKLVI